MWAIWAKYFLPQALKSCPKCNKLLNLVTLIRMECLGTKLDASGAFFHCFNRPNIEKIIKPQCPASSLTTCCFCIQVEQKSERCLFSSPNGVGKLKMMNEGIWKILMPDLVSRPNALRMNCKRTRRRKSLFKFCDEGGGSPGLVVMGGDSCSKVVGSNPGRVYWMDIFHIYLL